ncbi:MAG: NAD(P)H-hydrate dehydratase [Desulfobacterales bacterium]|jgi:NAD(P)H-hydrate epimerase
MKIATVSQMRQMDQSAIKDFGIPETILMENAGGAAHRVLRDHFPLTDRRVLVLCGSGNNGGDGLVVARKILSDGGRPKLLLLGDPDRFKGASALNWEIIQRLDIDRMPYSGPALVEDLLARCHLVVDGILGTGLSKPVRGHYAEVIARVNAAERPVMSLDIPSGIQGDTGQIMGTAVRADLTVTFGLPKVGNLLYPGYLHGGRLYVTHIAFPPPLTRAEHLTIALNEPPPLPERIPWGHKGSFGDALFIAGAAGYYGAPYLASMGLLKAGGGYARLAAPSSIVSTVAARGPEIVFLPQAETDTGSLALSNHPQLVAAAQSRDMVVIGPGLSLNDETARLVRRLVDTVPTPLLIDGDAITAISQQPQRLARRPGKTVLTPHLGEMARLTGRSTEAIAKDPIGTLQTTAEQLRACIVLKGAHTLIGFPDRRVFVNTTGNHAMATAGAGDVLTGTIAAMVGSGLPLDQAVCKGVHLHGAAGDIAAQTIGADGVVAGDILAHLPEAVRRERTPLNDPEARSRGLSIV